MKKNHGGARKGAGHPTNHIPKYIHCFTNTEASIENLQQFYTRIEINDKLRDFILKEFKKSVKKWDKGEIEILTPLK